MDNNEKNGRMQYVFIDYENVQPAELMLSNNHLVKILLFVGANQTKVSFELANSMQSLGDKAEYVRIDGNGKNALDFHIAYYCGKIFAEDPQAFVHIISKDTGYDSLIRYLKEKKYLIKRHNQMNDVLAVKITKAKSLNEKISIIIEFLQQRGNAKPKTKLALFNTINALFHKNLNEESIDKLITELSNQKKIVIEENKVRYQFPSAAQKNTFG